MKLKIGKKYKFLIDVGNKSLTFTGIINSIEDNFVEFTDKFGKVLHYNLNNIISWEEVYEDF